MRIGIISDSHGDIYGVRRAIKHMGSVDLIVHLGDYCRDAKKVSDDIGREIVYVRGNCDFSREVPSELIIEKEGKKIFLTHGHNYNVKSDYTNIYFKGLQEGADVVLFGHTHWPDVFEKDNILFLNPGSISMPRRGRETYGLLIIEGGQIFGNIVEFI